MKPPFKPAPILSRLEAVTNAASSKITQLETDVSWYKSALAQKATWDRAQEVTIAKLERQISVLWWALIGLNLALLACATALALRWL